MSNTNGVNIGVVGATGQVGAVVRRLLEERDFPVAEHPLLRVGARRPARRCRGRARTSSSRTPRPPTRRASTSRSSRPAPRPRRRRRRASPPPASSSSTTRAAGAWTPTCRSSSARSTRTPSTRRARASSPTRTAPPWPPCRCSRCCTTRPASSASSSRRTRRSRARPRGRRGAARAGACRRRAGRDRARARRLGRRRSPSRVKFPQPIAFDVIPLAGSIVDDGDRRDRRGEEAPQREPQDPRAARACCVSGTCVRVPVFTGHSLSINAEFAEPDHARARHRTAGGCPGRRARPTCPTPLEAAGNDPSFVGRIRQDEWRPTAGPRAVHLATTTCARARRSTPCRSPSSWRRSCAAV